MAAQSHYMAHVSKVTESVTKRQEHRAQWAGAAAAAGVAPAGQPESCLANWRQRRGFGIRWAPRTETRDNSDALCLVADSKTSKYAVRHLGIDGNQAAGGARDFNVNAPRRIAMPKIADKPWMPFVERLTLNGAKIASTCFSYIETDPVIIRSDARAFGPLPMPSGDIEIIASAGNGARDVRSFPEMRTDWGQFKDRRLMSTNPFSIMKKGVDADSGGFQSGSTSHSDFDLGDTMLNLHPKQMSNMGWNWDYNLNTTEEPEINIDEPGAKGRIRIYKPYVKMHTG
ncbi:unnamed protein product, partial [Prorocentrum cordatum]